MARPPYDEYIQSEAWKAKRQERLAFARHRCELCNRVEGFIDVHHRTYERLGDEDLSDLIALCRGCHEVFHDRLGLYDLGRRAFGGPKQRAFIHMRTGYPAFDDLAGGLQSGQLVVIGGRPGMGTTALALSVARNIVEDDAEDGAVLYVSLQSPMEELALRLSTGELGVDYRAVRTGRVDEATVERIGEVADRFTDLGLLIRTHSKLSIGELIENVRMLDRGEGIRLVIVDRMDNLGTRRNEDAEGNAETDWVVRGLKELALDRHIPVIAVSSLRRTVETRGGDKRPQLSDLGGWGAAEDEADVVAFLHRPERYGITQDEYGNSTAGLAELIVAKQRTGPIGTVALAFSVERSRFEPLNRRPHPFEGDSHGDTDGHSHPGDAPY